LIRFFINFSIKQGDKVKGNRSLTRNEIRAILKVKGVSSRDKGLFVLMLNTAMRISETLSLKIGDVSDKHGNIFSFLELRAKNTKTHQGASIPINSSARKALAKHVKKLLAMGLGVKDSLFGGRKFGYKTNITRQTAHKIFKKLYQLAGVSGGKLACHATRKTAVAAVYHKTKDLLLVKTILRHNSIVSTMSYLQSAMQSVQRAIMDLNFT